MVGFNWTDYDCMVELWGICCLCERSVFDNVPRNYNFHSKCGCFVHANEECPYVKVRESHWCGDPSRPRKICIKDDFKSSIVFGFVRKTYPFEKVEDAFRKYLSEKCYYLKSVVDSADRESGLVKKIASLNLELKEVRAGFESKLAVAEQKAEEATNELTVITEQIEKMKKDWKELQNQDVEKDSKNTKMTSFEFSPTGSDEHVLEVEWDKFKQKFSQVHRTVATMLQNSFDTRNSSLINSTVMKVGSATAATNEARNSVVEVLKRETGKLGELSISNDVVKSENKDDVKLLD